MQRRDVHHHPGLSLSLGGLLLLAAIFAAGAPAAAEAQSLRPSRSALARQGAVARQHDFSYLDDRDDVRRFVAAGYLVRVRGNADVRLAGVSFPYARPEVKLFVERLGRQYRSACGEKLVVTSLIRPRRYQPVNASSRSVHPTGMALDLRRPRRRSCRAWLEEVLLSLEGKGLLEAARERRPPHYHVALFPDPYRRYVARLETRTAATGVHRVSRGETLWEIAHRYGTSVDHLASLNGLASSRLVPGQRLAVPSSTHRVSRGETLWEIARRHGTTIDDLKSLNGLSSSRIMPGQLLKVPSTS